MRLAFVAMVLLHALIHLFGFMKGFGIKEVKELTLPISKPLGLGWLVAAILLLVYGILHGTNSKYAWLIGFLAVVVSQVLILLFWKDAKFGTLPNLIILVVAAISYGQYSFQKMVQSEASSLLAQNSIAGIQVVTQADLQHLPQPVRKWLMHTGMVGKPHISMGRVEQQAELKLKPEQDDWYSATALQHTTLNVPAFIWVVDVKMNSLVNFKGRDKFEAGKGEMLIKLNSLINVVDERGEKLNEGTLQRYLGELVWFPSLALSPYISWQEVNDTTAIATMEYKGTRGSGTFYFNADGDFVKFSALRYKDNTADAKRYEWVLLVQGYSTFEGIKVPSQMTATWKLDNQDWTWLKLEIKNIHYN